MAKLYKGYLGELLTRAEPSIPHRARFVRTSFLSRSKWQNYIFQASRRYAQSKRGNSAGQSAYLVVVSHCTVCSLLVLSSLIQAAISQPTYMGLYSARY